MGMLDAAAADDEQFFSSSSFADTLMLMLLLVLFLRAPMESSFFVLFVFRLTLDTRPRFPVVVILNSDSLGLVACDTHVFRVLGALGMGKIECPCFSTLLHDESATGLPEEFENK